MNKNLKRGFTLIELLVVIAIIGILAAVVIASLNSARSKGADAAKKANLSNARAQAELFYDTAGTYVGVCSTSTAGAIGNMVVAAGSTTTGTSPNVVALNCGSNATAYAAWASIDGGMWCIDSLGSSKKVLVVVPGATVCPAGI